MPKVQNVSFLHQLSCHHFLLQAYLDHSNLLVHFFQSVFNFLWSWIQQMPNHQKYLELISMSLQFQVPTTKFVPHPNYMLSKKWVYLLLIKHLSSLGIWLLLEHCCYNNYHILGSQLPSQPNLMHLLIHIQVILLFTNMSLCQQSCKYQI